MCVPHMVREIRIRRARKKETKKKLTKNKEKESTLNALMGIRNY